MKVGLYKLHKFLVTIPDNRTQTKRVFLMHKLTREWIGWSFSEANTSQDQAPPLNFNRRRATILTFGASVGQAASERKPTFARG